MVASGWDRGSVIQEPDGLMGPTGGEFGDRAEPLARVPAADADWAEIAEFALRFDGYAAMGHECGDLANELRRRWDATSELPGDLRELRASLFFEQRRFRHFGWAPTGRDRDYLSALLDAIRVALPDPHRKA
jgi:hypothetical protein